MEAARNIIKMEDVKFIHMYIRKYQRRFCCNIPAFPKLHLKLSGNIELQFQTKTPESDLHYKIAEYFQLPNVPYVPIIVAYTLQLTKHSLLNMLLQYNIFRIFVVFTISL